MRDQVVKSVVEAREVVFGLFFGENAVEGVFAAQLHHYDFSIHLLPIDIKTLVFQEVSHHYLHPKPRFCRRTHPILRLKYRVELRTIFTRLHWHNSVWILRIKLMRILHEFGLSLPADEVWRRSCVCPFSNRYCDALPFKAV